MTRIKLFLLGTFVFCQMAVWATNDTTANAIKNAPKVYVDCNYYCDLILSRKSV